MLMRAWVELKRKAIEKRGQQEIGGAADKLDMKGVCLAFRIQIHFKNKHCTY